MSQTSKTECEAVKGCTFHPSRCYCPFEDNDSSGGACVCGGGPPDRCNQDGGPETQ